MLVRKRGVWFEFTEKMFVFLGEIQKTCFLAKTTLILLFVHLQTVNGWSLRLLEIHGSSCFCE